jgi:transcriptional regulator with XRE-family HTH domain
MTHRQQIGSKIQELRVQRGLSVRQLAEMSGVIYSNISKIENGRYNVSVDILGKIADALGVELTMIEKEAE